ncbi:hypothetical protein [Shimia marina]|uniref:Uncharacterized protein n=1 Tax=Shimia marina TaxID=321267 RepID=A0A0P1F6R7_9RHOB|nr:hypothetical protein [Shimia marina]CUH50695.1 hypothetical protein SHM7688_00122 [Shimia marina]SFE36589.1 hypothetical protein SAMN04488037_10873 [Shimia marina]
MHKAYVGFSAPVGYDYEYPAEKTAQDTRSSPNPILVGVTGLLILFDEIWFPCRSICPQSMRSLDYVKFVNEEFDSLHLDDKQVAPLLEEMPQHIPLKELHPEGYSRFMELHYGSGRPDNHTHALSVFGATLGGDPSPRNLIRDMLLLDMISEDLTPVFNGLTRKIPYPDEFLWQKRDDEDHSLRIADRALTIAGLYDLTGHAGPYHPVFEELREHEFIQSFRKWIRGEASSLHNRSIDDVVAEIEETTTEFGHRARRTSIGKDGLKDVTVTFTKDLVLSAIPGASAVEKALGISKQRRQAEKHKMNTFVAEGQAALWREKVSVTPYFD